MKISSTERGLEETGVGACSRRERLGRGTAATVADEAMAHTQELGFGCLPRFVANLLLLQYYTTEHPAEAKGFVCFGHA